MKTRFREYENKSSIQKRLSRYTQGGTTERLGDKLGWWERRNIVLDDINEIVYTIDIQTNKRPDKVAHQYFNSTELEWVILEYNNIVDVNEEFIYGKKILIPSNQYVRTAIITRPVGN